MRVSFNMMYDRSVRHMNSALSDIARINEQTASQKRINRPSDDPSGYSRVLDLNSGLKNIEQYQENQTTAEGWLTLTDDVLRQASDMVTRLEELCEQAATGTYDADQREMIAMEARELYEELIGLANTEYAGDSIFAGSMIGTNAYELGLGATTRGDVGVDAVEGASESTILIEFASSGQIGVDAIDYRYTTDGGDTWTEGTLNAGDTAIDLGAARIELTNGSTVTAVSEEGASDGSAIWVRPAAIYQGDAESGVDVLHHGSSAVTAEASGEFDSPVVVRVDAASTLPATTTYSYSLDNGATWVEGQTADDGVLPVPDGYLTLTPAGATLSAGEQFVIQPHTAELAVDIGAHNSLTINNIGLDVFGGQWTPPGSSQAAAAEGANLFETVGTFIAYLESNNQDGIGECLDALTAAHEQLTVAAGEVGGRETRLEFAQNASALLAETIAASKSGVEDADVTQLSTDLAKAEYIYEAVLTTSSQVLGMSLLDYM